MLLVLKYHKKSWQHFTSSSMSTGISKNASTYLHILESHDVFLSTSRLESQSSLGLIKVNQEMDFSRFKPGIQLLISIFFIIRSGPGFQIWVSNPRFTSYLNSSFNLFLSNCLLLAFIFL